MLGKLIYVALYVGFKIMIWIGWWRWRVEGLENLPPREQGGMVMVMNHIHWVDIPVVGGLLPLSYRLSWLAKSELFRPPLLAWWFRQMQAIPIRRGRRDHAAFETAVEALRGGATLLIFPEGHRSHDGVLQPGRSGAVRMAMQSGMPIVPIAITGTEHGVKGSLRREPVVLRIGVPYKVAPTPDGRLSPERLEQLTAEMMARIAAMLPPAQRGPYGQLVQAEGRALLQTTPDPS